MSHEVSQRAPDVEWGWEALGGHTAPGALFGPQGLGGAFGALVGPKRFLRSVRLSYLATLRGPFGTFWGPWGPF